MKYSVFNTVTGLYEEVEVSLEVYKVLASTTEDFKSDEALYKSEQRHSRNFSELNCGDEDDDDGWESFEETKRFKDTTTKDSYITAYSFSNVTVDSFETAVADFKAYIREFDEFQRNDRRFIDDANNQFGIQIEISEKVFARAMSYDEFEKRYLSFLKSAKDKDIRLVFALFHLGMTEADFALVEGVYQSSVSRRKETFLKKIRNFFN